MVLCIVVEEKPTQNVQLYCCVVQQRGVLRGAMRSCSLLLTVKIYRDTIMEKGGVKGFCELCYVMGALCC